MMYQNETQANGAINNGYFAPNAMNAGSTFSGTTNNGYFAPNNPLQTKEVKHKPYGQF